MCLERRWIKRDIGTTLTPTWKLGRVKQTTRKLIYTQLKTKVLIFARALLCRALAKTYYVGVSGFPTRCKSQNYTCNSQNRYDDRCYKNETFWRFFKHCARIIPFSTLLWRISVEYSENYEISVRPILVLNALKHEERRVPDNLCPHHINSPDKKKPDDHPTF